MTEGVRSEFVSYDRGNIASERVGVGCEQPADSCVLTQDSLYRKVLVVKTEYRLDHMREGPVTDVVQERRDSNRCLNPFRDVMRDPQFRNESLGEVKRSKAVRKSRMLGRLVCKVRETELSDPPQPLKLRRVDQRNDKPSLRRVGIDTDNVMDGVAIDPLDD